MKKRVLAALLCMAMTTAMLAGCGQESSTEEDTAQESTDETTDEAAEDVEAEPVETLQFLLPEELEEPYLTYNELQDAQGFDLSACCGKQVARYTYTVTNYPGRAEGVQANLYICEGQPVAGDILCAGADGFQDTLVYPEKD